MKRVYTKEQKEYSNYSSSINEYFAKLEKKDYFKLRKHVGKQL
jgi:hypothetical protein